MNVSLKLVLAAWLLSSLLLSSSEAGKRSSFPTKASNKRSISNNFNSSNLNQRVQKSNKFSKKSNLPNNSNSKNNSRFQPKKNVITQSPNSSLIRSAKPNVNLPKKASGPFKKLKPIQNGQPKFNPNTIKSAKPFNGNSPIKNLKPMKGLTSITKPGLVKPGVFKPLPNPIAPGVLKPGVLKPILPVGKKPVPPGGGVVNPFPVPPLKPVPPGGGVVNPLPVPPLKPVPPGGGVVNPFPIPPLKPLPPGPLPLPPIPPYCPPHYPPHYCPPGFWPRPICLPPIHLHRPVCRPCVLAVCPTVIVDETIIAEEPVVEADVEPLLQLLVGKPASLEAEGLGEVPGAVAIEVGGIGLPTQVTAWTDTMLVIDVPFMGLNGPTPAMLHLFDSNGQPLASIPVELVVPVEELPAEAAE